MTCFRTCRLHAGQWVTARHVLTASGHAKVVVCEGGRSRGNGTALTPQPSDEKGVLRMHPRRLFASAMVLRRRLWLTVGVAATATVITVMEVPQAAVPIGTATGVVAMVVDTARKR